MPLKIVWKAFTIFMLIFHRFSYICLHYPPFPLIFSHEFSPNDNLAQKQFQNTEVDRQLSQSQLRQLRKLRWLSNIDLLNLQRFRFVSDNRTFTPTIHQTWRV